MLFLKLLLPILTLSLVVEVQALPMDWSGSFNTETLLLRNVRRTTDSCTVANGSTCIAEDENNARYQSMTLKLNPSLIVNDGITLNGELATGSPRTSRIGENTTVQDNNPSYYAQSTSSNLNINQFYADIYADTALYRVGRFSKNFGLGALINDGKGRHDHFFSGYEGVEAHLKLGNFNLIPAYTKLHTSQAPNGSYDVYETSLHALYDNTNKNMKFGLFYAVREVETKSKLYTDGANNSTGAHNVTLIDVFIQKTWDKVSLGIEVPMLSGEVGSYYTGDDADFDTNAYIFELGYKLNSRWTLNLNAGYVKGDDGSTDSFEGMYLHPNYKLGKILYNYNLRGFNNSAYNVHNAAISNSTYTQFLAVYSSNEWTWKLSALWAQANETASEGDDFYDHEQGALVTSANADQGTDLGYELSAEFDYQWNPSLVLSGHLAYLFTGEYYNFLNDANEELGVENVISTGMSLSVKF